MHRAAKYVLVPWLRVSEDCTIERSIFKSIDPGTPSITAFD
jgi:hypothetical protein